MMKRGEGEKTIQVVFHETTVPDIDAHQAFPPPLFFSLAFGFKVMVIIEQQLYLKGFCRKSYCATLC